MVPEPAASMSCEEAALALMLRVDEVAVTRAERHRARCSQCGISEGDRTPHNLQTVLPSPPRLLIWALLILGTFQAFMAIPWLVGSDPFGFLGSAAPATHTTRDGVVGLVVAVAAILAAVRPRWARPAFLISASVIVAQAVAGVIDESIAETGPPEAIHLLGVLLTVLMGLAVASQLLKPLGPQRRRGLFTVDPDD